MNAQAEIEAIHQENTILTKAVCDAQKEIDRLKKYKMFFESCSCFFAEGTEFMTKTEIYEAIKQETKKLEKM
jgi:hypothetical protein